MRLHLVSLLWGQLASVARSVDADHDEATDGLRRLRAVDERGLLPSLIYAGASSAIVPSLGACSI
jgi:hypothetical protein